MKAIEISVTGLPLFPETLKISFLASQRVSEKDTKRLCQIVPGIYVHCANAFIGVNASGKTSVLKVILLALSILKNDPINFIEGCNIMGKAKNVCFETVFYANPDKICKLRTEVSSTINNDGDVVYHITNESLWEKDITNLKKKAITEFNDDNLVAIRKQDEEYLSEDVSFIIARNKREKESINLASVLYLTDFNMLPFSTEISMDIVTFLDPTIEMIRIETVNEKRLVRLKFYGKNEIVLNSQEELEVYLSSGTIKGMVVFSLAWNVLRNGGYLIVDEIENHFNYEIVATLIRLFLDSGINRNGAALIFSTHYPELLDEYDRNDGIYIMRNRNGITAQNLNDILSRNDIKRSEAYQSGVLGGTTPEYDAYIKLKKSVVQSLAEA